MTNILQFWYGDLLRDLWLKCLEKSDTKIWQNWNCVSNKESLETICIWKTNGALGILQEDQVWNQKFNASFWGKILRKWLKKIP